MIDEPFDPASPDLRATRLNPEAGAHPIPEDPREIAAALRASERVLAQYPYLLMRFGERGRRFADSDTAWLVTLVRHPPRRVNAQTAWLGEVLASRGIPRILLERHLVVLAEELRRVDTIRAEDADKLSVAAETLAARRRAWIEDAQLATIARSFEQRLDDTWRERLPNSAEMIVSAVADEADGLTEAVSSTLGWLTDAERFPPAWIAAVEGALAQARASLKRLK
ncbi:hypothetical protein [Thiocapsa roseopersicina]|uniref:Uncharacterized protein n=1 Tax=Thiocapsa roseopersicina TaxID=1058 RepID=A0A1H2RXB7_THIRO|nr:hypothetical protein [Thiocapsa roseopersicina]SDW24121.1 hypothetical protein SAMN05421783_102212 [Thiocapsa roseopersicina]